MHQRLTLAKYPGIRSEVGEIRPVRARHSRTHYTLTENEVVHAFDRDPSTISATESKYGTGNFDPESAWLQLQLERVHFVHKVVIYGIFYTKWYNPTHWCIQSTYNFEKCIEFYTNVNVKVYLGYVEQKSCGNLELSTKQSEDDQIYTVFCNVEGDSIMLISEEKILGKNQQIAVREVVITGKGICHLSIYFNF